MKTIPISKAIIIFGAFTAYFYFLANTLFPFLQHNFSLDPSIYWFITGYFLFIPLFVFALLMVRKEGYSSKKEIFEALGLRKLSKKDWRYIIFGTLLIFMITGAIFGISGLLHQSLGWSQLETNPVFMEEFQAYTGWDKLYLLVWLPMFFFNIVGEEILWRGYIQYRLNTRYSWIICAALWAVFHIPFGMDLIIMASPAFLIIPYVFQKTKNTTIAIAMHGIYNGPIFVLISLGAISN